MAEKPRDIETIFNTALKKASGKERSSYLDKVCGTDHALRARVEALLEASQEVGNFLEPPVVDPDGTLDESPGIEGPGTKIGHYELLELIGEGGMGLVYLAEQKEPVKRRVALKIIKPGMDSKQVIARFEAERQALAVLDHPNIAHVFDAGTTEAGRPYFVMEHVKGMSITAYCDERKLNIEQRLRLFEQVCEGIHHAHQKGIIHRDLKPSNTLVSVHGDRAVPKIIDFGIAKAITQPLTEKTFVTFQGQLLGTPEYMSPEQVDLATQDIDTRSDIYALGIVLYELLAGILPFERESLAHLGFAEVQRTIREQEPASPSIRITSLGDEAKTIAASRGTEVITLARRLHRELEWIPMKAMRKDRCRRYRSASEMADDVRNYLNGLPLIAGPETTIYRVQKFVSKHAGSVATIALVAAAIVLGLVASTVLYLRSEKALQREATARVQAEDAKDKEATARILAEQAEKAAQKQRRIAEQQAEANRQALYFNRIAYAQVVSPHTPTERTHEVLKSCPEDLRGWEWYHLWHALDQSLLTIKGHDGGISDVAWSPCGRYFASSSYGRTITVWDAQTAMEILNLRGHEGYVRRVSFSPDSTLLAAACSDKFVRVYQIPSGIEVFKLQGHDNSVTCVAFASSGDQLASGDILGVIKVWDSSTGANRATFRNADGFVSSVAFLPGTNRIVTSSGKVVRVWDVATQTEVMTLHGHTELIRSVAVTPDGKRIVSAGEDSMIKVWDALNGNELMTLRGHTSTIHTVAISPDGTRLVSAGTGDRMIKLWDLDNGQELLTYLADVYGVGNVTFSPDGEQILSGGMMGDIKVWDVTRDSSYTILEGHRGGRVGSLSFSSDGNSIVSGRTNGAITLWDVTSSTEIGTMGEFENARPYVAFHPNGRQIASGHEDGRIVIWDTSTRKTVRTILGHADRVTCLAFSPDGRRLVSGSDDKTIRIWNSANGDCEQTLTGHEDGVQAVAFRQDGRHIASGGHDNTVRVWDADNGAEIKVFRGHTGEVGSVVFAPDEQRIISGGFDGTVRVWDVEEGMEPMLLHGHDRYVFDLAVSPDGRRIASLEGMDRTVIVWDAATGNRALTIPIPGMGGVSKLAFSPNGKTIAVASGTGILLLESEAPGIKYKAQRRHAKKARGLVDRLYAEHQSYSEVSDLLNADTIYDKNVRETALQISISRQWEDHKRAANESFEIARVEGKDFAVYQHVMEQAQKAHKSQPDDWLGLAALGIAQYRTGAYDEACKSLLKAYEICMSLHKDASYVELSFIAMAQYKSGRTDEARSTLNTLRNRLENVPLGSITPDKLSGSCEIEAERIFAGANSQLLAIWDLIDRKELDQAVEMYLRLRSPVEGKGGETNFALSGVIKYLSRLYYARGKCHLIDKDQDYIDRVSDYETSVRIDPNYVFALKDLAWLRATCFVEEVRNPARALELATLACQLTNWKNHECLSVLGGALSEVARYTEAAKWQQEAIALLSPTDQIQWEDNYKERLRLYQSNTRYGAGERWSFNHGEIAALWDFRDIEDGMVINHIAGGPSGRLVGEACIVKDAQRGAVLDLNGNGKMECSRNAIFDISGAISVGAWIKVRSLTKNSSIIAKGDKTWCIYADCDSNSIVMDLSVVKNEEYLQGLRRVPYFGVSVLGEVNFADEQWHHVAGTYDGGRLCLYIDGTLSDFEHIHGNIEIDDSVVVIGDSPEFIGDNRWNGLIDDVRIYSYALSPEEVKMLYEGKEPPRAKLQELESK